MMNLVWLMVLLMHPALNVMGECPFYNCDRYFSASLVCKNMSLGHVAPCNYSNDYAKFKDIVLKNLNITSLHHKVFCQMPKLTTIYLSNNSLEKLDYRLFAKQKYLRYLDLKYNKLIYLDNRIFQSQMKMRTLFLTGNRLTSLNSSVLAPLKSLTNLKLNGNPFVCDSRLKDTMLWCKERNLETNATCNNGLSWSEFNFTESYQMANFTEDMPKVHVNENVVSEEQSVIIIASSVSVVLQCFLLVAVVIYCKYRKSKAKDRSMYIGTKTKENVHEFLVPPKVTESLK